MFNQEFRMINNNNGQIRPMTSKLPPKTKEHHNPNVNRPLSTNTHQQLKDNFIKDNQQNNTEIINNYTHKQIMPIQSIQKLVRIKPKKIQKEKEMLYEDLLNLKNKQNLIQTENMKLKTKIKQLESENNKQMKVIQEMQYSYGNQNDQQKETNLNDRQVNVYKQQIIRMKKQMNSQHEELIEKDQIIEGLKKGKKITQVQELESELQQYQNETYRLRNMLEYLKKGQNGLQSKEESMMFMDQIQKKRKKKNRLKEDNIKMAGMIRELEDKLELMVQKNKELERGFQKELKEKGALKNQLVKLEYLSQNNYFNKNNKEYQAEKQDFEDHVDKLQYEIKQCQDCIAELNDKHGHLEIQLLQKEMKLKSQEKELKAKIEIEQQLNQSQQQKHKDQKNIYQKLYNKMNKLLDIMGTDEIQLDEIFGNQEDEHGVLMQIQQMVQFKVYRSNKIKNKKKIDYEKKRQPKVNKYEIEDMGVELKYNLVLNLVEFENIHMFLFNNEIMSRQNQMASVEDMINQLQKKPFEIAKSTRLVQLSRYLIEDNEEAFMIVDMDKKCDVIRIRSIIKTLIGQYVLLDEQQEKQIYDELSQLFKKYKVAIKDQYHNLVELRKKEEKNIYPHLNVKRSEMEDLFKYIDANLNNHESEYFYIQMFKKTRKVDMIDLNYIFEYFTGDCYVRQQKHELLQNLEDEYQNSFINSQNLIESQDIEV